MRECRKRRKFRFMHSMMEIAKRTQDVRGEMWLTRSSQTTVGTERLAQTLNRRQRHKAR